MRSGRGPLTAGPPQGLDPSLPPGARVAAHFPIQEPKRVRHYVTDIRQAQQHEWYAHDRIEYGNYLAV